MLATASSVMRMPNGALEAFRRKVSDRCLPVDCSDQ
jgi:hypothetical protein